MSRLAPARRYRGRGQDVSGWGGDEAGGWYGGRATLPLRRPEPRPLLGGTYPLPGWVASVRLRFYAREDRMRLREVSNRSILDAGPICLTVEFLDRKQEEERQRRRESGLLLL